MQSHSLCKHVVSHATHLDSIRSEKLSSVHKAASFEGNRVVSLVHDQHADDSLVSIDNEIATEFMHVFFLGDQLGLA